MSAEWQVLDQWAMPKRLPAYNCGNVDRRQIEGEARVDGQQGCSTFWISSSDAEGDVHLSRNTRGDLMKRRVEEGEKEER